MAKKKEEGVMEIREIVSSKAGAVGVATYFKGYEYHSEQIDCLHRDPFGMSATYIFKQGKWLRVSYFDGETKTWIKNQITEVTNAALLQELTVVNDKLRPFIAEVVANKGQQANLVQ